MARGPSLLSDEIANLVCMEWLAGEIYDVEQAEVCQGPRKKLVNLAAHLSHGEPLPFETWIASLCERYHKLPSEILRELEGDSAELFRAVMASDHFMAGWEARLSKRSASEGLQGQASASWRTTAFPLPSSSAS